MLVLVVVTSRNRLGSKVVWSTDRLKIFFFLFENFWLFFSLLFSFFSSFSVSWFLVFFSGRLWNLGLLGYFWIAGYLDPDPRAYKFYEICDCKNDCSLFHLSCWRLLFQRSCIWCVGSFLELFYILEGWIFVCTDRSLLL